MILHVFSVFDSKARVFLAPFMVQNADVAKRAFAGAANSADTQIYKHPEDFTLFHLGSFNDELGTYELFDMHENLGLASLYKTKSE